MRYMHNISIRNATGCNIIIQKTKYICLECICHINITNIIVFSSKIID